MPWWIVKRSCIFEQFIFTSAFVCFPSVQFGTYTELLANSGAFAEFLQTYTSENQSANFSGNLYYKGRKPILLCLLSTLSEIGSGTRDSTLMWVKALWKVGDLTFSDLGTSWTHYFRCFLEILKRTVQPNNFALKQPPKQITTRGLSHTVC